MVAEVKKEEVEFNKILIKLPMLGDKVFTAFPFLIILSEEFPKASFSIIVEEGESDAFKFLPFKARVFERPAVKKSLIETHHYVANMNEIFNIDLFLDLENTFNSAFIGFNFRATNRIGFEMGWNKHLLTKSYKELYPLSFEKNSISLLEQFLGKNYSDVKISNPIGDSLTIDKIEQLFNVVDPPKFILVMLDNFANVEKEIEIWKSFFDSFEKQKFIIWTLADEDIISEIFAKIDLERNELFMHRGVNPQELNYILRKVIGIVVNNNWAESLCGYYNSTVITFISHERELPTYQYFRFYPQRISFKENIPVKMLYRDEEKNFEKMNEVVDFIHFHFKL